MTVRARFAAQVDRPGGASAHRRQRALPGTVGDPAPRRRARLRLRFPLDNFGPSIPNLLAAVAGNLFELKELAAVKLIDLELPPAFAERYARSAVRRRRHPRSGWVDPTGAMIGTIVKPSIGLSPGRARRAGRRARRGRASTSSRTTSCRATARTRRSPSVCAP